MTGNAQFDVNRVLETVGARGCYQVINFLLVMSMEFPAVFQLLDNVYIGRDVEFRCSPPANGSDFLRDVQQYPGVNVTRGECSLEARVNGSLVAQTSCQSGVDFLQPRDKSVISQFDLVCEKKALFSLTQTLLFVGQGIGALLGPPLTDRYGRKPSLIGSNVTMMVVGIAMACSPTFLIFAICKLVMGAFQQAAYITKSVYLLELLVIKDRKAAAIFPAIMWALGEIVLAITAYLLRYHSWRTLKVVISLSSLTFIPQILFLDESLIWLVANGKSKEIKKCIKRACKMNKKSFDAVFKAGYSRDETSAELIGNPEGTDTVEMSTGTAILDKKTRKLTFVDLFRERRLLTNALVIWTAWFTVALGFFTLYLTASTLSGDFYINYIFIGLSQVPMSFVVFVTYERFGRKPTTIAFFTLIGVSLFGIGLCRHLSSSSGDVFSTLTLLFTLLGTSGSGGCFFCIFFYSPELFPTNIRNQATGMASFVARLGAIFSPFTGFLMDYVVWGPGLILGCLATMVALLVTSLPETRGRELPQTIEDLKAWYSEPVKPSSSSKVDNETTKD